MCSPELSALTPLRFEGQVIIFTLAAIFPKTAGLQVLWRRMGGSLLPRGWGNVASPPPRHWLNPGVETA